MILNYVVVGIMCLAFGGCVIRGNIEGMLGWACAIICYIAAVSH